VAPDLWRRLEDVAMNTWLVHATRVRHGGLGDICRLVARRPVALHQLGVLLQQQQQPPRHHRGPGPSSNRPHRDRDPSHGIPSCFEHDAPTGDYGRGRTVSHAMNTPVGSPGQPPDDPSST
jgi:hypothetical protein